MLPSGIAAASPVSIVDAIVTLDKNPPLWAEWALVVLFAVGVLVLLYVAARGDRSSETLNTRSAREVEEARR